MKQTKLFLLLRAAALILGGLLLILYPTSTLATAATILGVALVVYGAVSLVSYFFNRQEARSLTLIAGVAAVIFGIVVLARPSLVINFFPTVGGVLIIVAGVWQVLSALDLRRAGGAWKLPLVLAVVTVILGAVILFNPFGTMALLVRLLGAALLFIGVTGLFPLLAL